MESDDEDLVKQIKLLESNLKKLRLKLEQRKKKRNQEEVDPKLKIGDRVKIVNPSEGQDNRGKIIRINSDSGFHTVFTDRKKESVRRFAKFLVKIDN